MKLEIEQDVTDCHHWRLVVTAADLGADANGLDRRLRVIGGGVRAKLDYAPRRCESPSRVRRPAAARAAPARATTRWAVAAIGSGRTDPS